MIFAFDSLEPDVFLIPQQKERDGSELHPIDGRSISLNQACMINLALSVRHLTLLRTTEDGASWSHISLGGEGIYV